MPFFNQFDHVEDHAESSLRIGRYRFRRTPLSSAGRVVTKGSNTKLSTRVRMGVYICIYVCVSLSDRRRRERRRENRKIETYNGKDAALGLLARRSAGRLEVGARRGGGRDCLIVSVSRGRQKRGRKKRKTHKTVKMDPMKERSTENITS